MKILYQRNGFYGLLQSRFQRNKKCGDNYEDIYDGQVYKQLSEPGNHLSYRNNISFSWNTDGVSLYKSSKFQIWPFYLSINKLPYIYRTRKENLLLAGLWFGPKKPRPQIFLKNISDELNELENDGINIHVPGNVQRIHVHAKVICGTCDLPAKALFLNMKQYNGMNGCQTCLITSEPLNPGLNNTRIYRFQETLNLRTQEQTNNFAREAVISGDDVFGVKGPSAISRFSPDYIKTTAVDSMHCIYLGVVRALLIIWFHPSTGIFSEFSQIVDEQIQTITPPDFIPRAPRSIIEHIMYLKASELKAWFFYYSVPILRSIMADVYFEHYLLFIYSIYILNQESVSDAMINTAAEFLKLFVSQFEDLYGRENMTANLHQILHLANNVKNFGPLWTTSCFPYENANGILKSLVTGTKFAHLQICSGISIFLNLPELTKNLVPGNRPFNFCSFLINKKEKYKSHQISVDMSLVGCLEKNNNELPDIVHQALQQANINGSNIKLFYRLLKSGILFTSQLYQRNRKTNSMFVKYRHENQHRYGKIICFVKISNCNCRNYCQENCGSQYFAILKKYQITSPFNIEYEDQQLELFFINECTETNEVNVVHLRELITICCYTDIKTANINTFIIDPVNMLEKE